MKYWDASALLPLLLQEPRSSQVDQLARKDPSIVTWWGTPVECFSALWRRKREELFSDSDFQAVKQRLSELTKEIDTVPPSKTLRDRVIRLLSLHILKAADALQLAAALRWTQDQTAGAGFVSFDERLRAAALAEGFTVLP